MSRPVLTPLFLALALSTPVAAESFSYHDYDGMVAELEAFAAAYPNLVEHFTAQEEWGLPSVFDGPAELEHHILRITNESLGLDKPELLLVGVQHGNEVVGLEVCLETARLLLESHGSDPWLTALVDRREIYLVPMVNPHGFNNGVRWSPGSESGSEDMNRDHTYDRCGGGFCSDEVSLSTVGARALYELSRRHLFRVMLDYHGGVELILHPWGSPLHTGDTESPDHQAADLLGLRLQSYGGAYNGLSPVGTANDLLGPAYGPLDDTSYAATWDAANADPAWPGGGYGAISYTIEISDQKTPPASTLGGDAELLVPGGAEDGYVPKNLRVALASIDAVEPWVVWTNRDQLPTAVAPGTTVSVEWQVRGCFQVDDTRVRLGADPAPRVTWEEQTASQSQLSGTPCFGTPTTFSVEVVLSDEGTTWLVPVAKVDQTLLTQTSPDPPLGPRSWLVRSRTEEGVIITNATDPDEVNTVVAQLYRAAEPLAIEVSDAIFDDGFDEGSTAAWSAESSP